jgi:biopolymer transport protein ExbB
MIQMFIKGGPIMWPILLASIVALTVVVERIFFILAERVRRQPQVVGEILARVEKGDVDGAIRIGESSRDFVARVLTYGLSHRDKSVSEALLRASNWELKRFNRGLSVLDTIITLAPLLGLLGTVTGMIHSFGLLGASELGAPAAITGGIAEALIATAFGLGVAITALLPFNYLNARLEEARLEIQDAASHIELNLMKRGPSCAFQTIDNIETADT